MRELYLIIFLSIFCFRLNAVSQCFLRIIRLSDTSYKVIGTGDTTFTASSAFGIEFKGADFFSTPPTMTASSGVNNSWQINGIGAGGLGSTSTGNAGVTFIPALTGNLVSSGDYTITFPNGILKSVGADLDIYLGSSTVICSVKMTAPDPEPLVETVLLENGDIIIGNSDHGLILKSPNGKLWRLGVDDTGNLQISEISNKP